MNQLDSTVGVPQGSATFLSTHWSMVLAAGTDSPAASAALEELCRTYWYPLYAYVRRLGNNPHDAQDLTQEFFARLIKEGSLGSVHPSKGKFRSFLLAAMKHFLAKEWRKENAQRRGGGQPVFSLDAAAAEGHYKLEPVDDQNPEKIFERRWAMTLLDHALAKLRLECSETGKAALFEELKGILVSGKCEHRYAEIAARLKSTEGAVKKAAERMRTRYGEILRMEIAKTVIDPAEVDEELRYLLRALQG
jgi:RNA polymerase sigma-70 factor (ECF subfamily)